MYKPKITHFTHSIWFNNLLRQLYRWLPLSAYTKQRLKNIYLGRSEIGKISRKNIFQGNAKADMLPLMAANAGQFNPANPWVLVVDLRIPTPDQDSGSVRMSAILRLLREMGFGVTFISDSLDHALHYQSALEKLNIAVLNGFNSARSHLAEAGGKYHFVLLSRPEVAFQYLPYVRAYALYSKVIYDMVDLHWVRFEREMHISGDCTLLDTITRFRRLELFNAASADLVLAITKEEKSRVLEEQPGINVAVLPNIHEVFPTKTPFAHRRGLLFIGGFWHKPNEDAVIFFVNNILPRIIKKIPDLVFYIIGSNMPSSVQLLRSVNVEPLGFVPDIVPYFESSRIFIAPLRFGAGMKGKVGHSMSHGLPVVTTRIGAEGMGLEHEKHVLIADSDEYFADCVTRLYADEILWHKLSSSALAHLNSNYSLSAAQQRMADIFTGARSGSGVNTGQKDYSTSFSPPSVGALPEAGVGS
jgi:glycosyltransferase involved in cell wall biosynthesis